MKNEFLLEIGAEEIPAGYVLPACDALADGFRKALESLFIGCGDVRTYAGPRRIALLAADVDETQSSRQIEKLGPPRSAAFDDRGEPTRTALGFAKSQGVAVSDLVVVETPKGEQVAVRKTLEGRPTAEVLAEILPGLIERIPFPKSMRWMDMDVRFARPVHWIVAMLGPRVVRFRFGNIESGNESTGHIFTHPGPVKIASPSAYADTLRKVGVLVDFAERRKLVEKEIAELSAKVGLSVYEDAQLLEEVSFLTESPCPIMGTFPVDFLELPASILITCMKKHQRYFSLHDAEGRIVNRFIAVNNTPVKDSALSVKGHERVIKARLEDARFYFKEDRKRPLIDRLEALKGVVFHSKLGTSFEKVTRIADLAAHIAHILAPERVEDVRRAALLAKCDLETGIVYEFPELQGIIGSYYARMDGEKDEIAVAVREHYLPAFSGDSLPSGVIGATVSLADRLDTIVGCFSVGLVPTGAADPYALRRHALAVIQILMNQEAGLSLSALVEAALKPLESKRTRDVKEIISDVTAFFRARFVNFHTSRDFAQDVVEAAVRAGFDDVTDARKRVEALQAWRKGKDFDAIVTGFKRVTNILKGGAGPSACDPSLMTEAAEKDLYSRFVNVRERTAPLTEQRAYDETLEIVSELRPCIDAFFDRVMVMVDDDAVRMNRLGLMREIADFLSNLADFSYIGSTAR
jgi:glycyl-tRNA synthetase beta chain